MRDDGYNHAVRETAGRIRATVPGDLVERFAAATSVRPGDFVACRPAPCGEVAAVDGSNAALLASGSVTLAAFRAALVTFRDMERGRRSVTPVTFALVGPDQENGDFPVLYADCFGCPPGTPLANDDAEKAVGVLRDTLEYWVTETAARELGEGALLLRDGPLRVSHASHDAVLSRTIAMCRERGVQVAGVSKRSTATWGGGHPLPATIYHYARAHGIAAPWWIRIDPAILDHRPHAQWQHGAMYIACLHPHATGPLKIELPVKTPDDEAAAAMDRLAACSADGRIPGYPFPLFDAHRAVALTEEVVEQLKGDMIAALAAAGIDRQTYEILFGDYHDAFARY